MPGVTETGFEIKRLSDILDDMVAALSTVTDPVTGEALTPDLADENDPLVQVVNAIGDGLAELWEVAQLVHNQYDPLKSIGAGLSGLVQLNGLTRNAGTYGSVQVSLTGTPGKTIPAGKQITTNDDILIFELPAFTFDGGGTALAIATAVEKTTDIILSGELVKILTPVAGWDSVTNPLNSLPGSLEETDTDLRARQQVSTAATGKSTIEDLYGSLSDLDSVQYCRVYQNIDLVDDAREIPGKTVAVVILGGDDDAIGQLIFEHLATGCRTFGDTVISITDDQGILYPIKFSRPSEIEVFIDIDVTVTNLALWPSDGVDLIKAAILAYAAGNPELIGIQEGFDQDGYLPGDYVYASELYTPVNSVQGHKINSLKVGIVAPAVDTEVAIQWNEIASFLSANINVTVS